MAKPTYLGVGLYAKMERGQIVLMANSHDHPTDTVYLDPDVWGSLKRWVQEVEDEYAKTVKDGLNRVAEQAADTVSGVD